MKGLKGADFLTKGEFRMNISTSGRKNRGGKKLLEIESWSFLEVCCVRSRRIGWEEKILKNS